MSKLSRRGFFKKFGMAAMDYSLPHKIGPGMASKPLEEIPLGRLSEFPPGEERRIFCRGGCLIVSSSEDGLRAEWQVGDVVSPVPLRLQRGGELVVDLDLVCSRRSVFSLMTGEMTENE